MSEDHEKRIFALEEGHKKMRNDFNAAFPAGDFEGHRRYHKLMIDDIEARKALTKAILERSISGLIWAGALGLGAYLWKGFLALVNQGHAP